VLFEMPGVHERERIWQLQLHARTPVAEDVDFRALAERHAVSGGDIRNAVLKAAMSAAAEPGGDGFKAIHQQHFEEGIREVVAGKRVMQQSVMEKTLSPTELVDELRQGRRQLSALTLPVVMMTSVSALVLALIALAFALTH
jgi:ATP-dependent Zn protease